jgi:ribosomal protein S6
LAYPIRYQGRDVRDGYYVLYFFDVASSQIAEIEREIRLNDKLIRHILTIRGETPPAAETEEGAEGEAAESAEASTEAPDAEAPAETAGDVEAPASEESAE